MLQGEHSAILLTFIKLPIVIKLFVLSIFEWPFTQVLPYHNDIIPARSHTFVEIDHEIISTVILLPSADSFKKGCCQLQAKVCAQITG